MSNKLLIYTNSKRKRKKQLRIQQTQNEIIVVQNNTAVQVENVFAVIQDDDRTYFNL